jgi:transposase
MMLAISVSSIAGVIHFLLPLARKRNMLIPDNTSRHEPKRLDRRFFEPLYLPPCSSEFNPIERICLVMKAEYFAK